MPDPQAVEMQARRIQELEGEVDRLKQALHGALARFSRPATDTSSERPQASSPAATSSSGISNGQRLVNVAGGTESAGSADTQLYKTEDDVIRPVQQQQQFESSPTGSTPPPKQGVQLPGVPDPGSQAVSADPHWHVSMGANVSAAPEQTPAPQSLPQPSADDFIRAEDVRGRNLTHQSRVDETGSQQLPPIALRRPMHLPQLQAPAKGQLQSGDIDDPS